MDAFFVIDINHYITAFYRTGASHRDASAHEFNDNYLYIPARRWKRLNKTKHTNYMKNWVSVKFSVSSISYTIVACSDIAIFSMLLQCFSRMLQYCYLLDRSVLHRISL